MATFVGKNGIIFWFKAKVAYTFSPAEEKLNQQLATKKERKRGLVKRNYSGINSWIYKGVYENALMHALRK